MSGPVPRLPERAFYKGETWLECEELSGERAFWRRARVRFPCGEFRVVRCGLPDTMFSIPARANINGRTVRGFVMIEGEELTFTEEKSG